MHYLFLVILFISLACTKPRTPAAPKTVLDEPSGHKTSGCLRRWHRARGRVCDDGNQIEMGTVVDGDMDNCSNACEPLTANHVYALENADKEAQSAQTVAQWEAQRAAMEANFKGATYFSVFYKRNSRPAQQSHACRSGHAFGFEANRPRTYS